MKVAVFYPRSIFSAWSVSEGIVDTLKRMGHETLNCGIDPKSETISKSEFPKHEELNECDVILVSGPEHIRKYVHALYPGWKHLKAKKVGWMHETVERADYGKLPIEGIKSAFDVLYTPAAQDEKYGMTWLPFGVDTAMFIPGPAYGSGLHWAIENSWAHNKRDIEVAFIGIVYGPRQEFLKKLAPHLDDVKITIGNCQVQDLSGVNIRKSAELYASELRRTKVLLNLPSLCRHTVTKVFEGMSCGSIVVTEDLKDRNSQLLHEAALLYYDAENPKELAELLREVIDRGYESIAKAGTVLVHKEHSLENRLKVILN